MKQVVLVTPPSNVVTFDTLANGMPSKHYLLVWCSEVYKLVTDNTQRFHFAQLTDPSAYCSSFKYHINYKDAFQEVFNNEFANEMQIYEFDTALEVYEFVCKGLKS